MSHAQGNPAPMGSGAESGAAPIPRHPERSPAGDAGGAQSRDPEPPPEAPAEREPPPSQPPSANHRFAWQVALVFLLVLASRVPFLDNGYGEHADGWRVARTAKMLAETSTYEPSRVPGFPIHEALCALLWRGRAPGLNGLSAIASAAACALFAMYARRRGCRHAALIALALGSLPAVFINSVSAKDFTLTLAFLLASALAASAGRPGWAGLALGAAAGCRSVAAIQGLPLALIVLSVAAPPARLRHFLRFFLVASAVAAVCYLPIIAKFGRALIHLSNPLGYPPLGIVIERGTVGVWGWLGLAALTLMLFGAIGHAFTRRAETALPAAPRLEWVAWLLFVALSAAFYLWLPDQAGYWIPGLPFALLIAARFTPRRVFQIACVLMLPASFVGFGRPGPILADQTVRRETLAKVRGFAGFCGTLPGAGVIVAGAWEPILSVLDLRAARHRFTYLLEPEEVRVLAAERRPIYFTPETRAFEFKIHGLDLAQYGGIDVRTVYLQQQRAQPAPR